MATPNIYQSFRTYFLIFKYSGLSSLTLIPENRKFELYKWDLLKSATLCLFILITFVATSACCASRDKQIHTLVLYGFMLIQVFGTLTVILTSQFKLKAFPEICRLFYELDEEIASFTEKRVALRRSNALKWHLIGCYILLGLNALSDGSWYIFAYLRNSYSSALKEWVCVISYYFPVLLLTHCCCAHIFFTIQLKARMRFLNEFVSSVRKERRCVVYIERPPKLLEDIITELSCLYEKMWHLKRKMDSPFQFALLIKLAWLFLSMTLCFYHIIDYYYFSMNLIFWETGLRFLRFGAYIILILMDCLGNIYASEGIYKEASETVELLEEIQDEFGTLPLSYKQVELFQIQTFLNNSQLSTYGLFTLNWSLIYSMAAGVSTYLIYLVQFRVKERTSA